MHRRNAIARHTLTTQRAHVAQKRAPDEAGLRVGSRLNRAESHLDGLSRLPCPPPPSNEQKRHLRRVARLHDGARAVPPSGHRLRSARRAVLPRAKTSGALLALLCTTNQVFFTGLNFLTVGSFTPSAIPQRYAWRCLVDRASRKLVVADRPATTLTACPLSGNTRGVFASSANLRRRRGRSLLPMHPHCKNRDGAPIPVIGRVGDPLVVAADGETRQELNAVVGFDKLLSLVAR